jgi:hypothetical protein
MNVIIQKLNGLWHLIVGSCQIRTPFSETQDRALVIAYARRIYPGAKIFERDWPLRGESDSTHQMSRSVEFSDVEFNGDGAVRFLGKGRHHEPQ